MGQNRDQYANANYNWIAVKEDYQNVLLTITSNLAIAYYQLRAADAELDLLESTLKTRREAYQINLDRYEGKITFYSDVSLAGEEVDTALNQYEETKRQRAVLENQIAVLLGLPASEFSLEHLPLASMPPCIPEGVPSEILLRRPDIAEAYYDTRAQHALVKRAVALFFPSLTLTGALGYESPLLKNFLTWFSRYWTMGAASDQIVFDGLRTPYNLDLQISRLLETNGTYQQLVLTAFQEVEDALKDIDSYATQYDTALDTTKWAEISYQLYKDRYTLGVTYYIDVVNTERDLLAYQITLNQLLGFRYVATVQLIKSLGGGWSL